jgi:hypothetical protein
MSLQRGDFKHVTADGCSLHSALMQAAASRAASREVVEHPESRDDHSSSGRARAIAVAAAASSHTFTLQWPSHRCSGR